MKLTFCNGTVLHRNQVRSTFGDWLDGITELSKSLQAIDIDASAYACLSALTLVNGESIWIITGTLSWPSCFSERHGLLEPKKVESLQTKIINSLRDHVTYNPDAQKKPHYLSRILDKLQVLRSLSQQALQRIFYLRLEGLVPEPPIIKKLFSSSIPFWDVWDTQIPRYRNQDQASNKNVGSRRVLRKFQDAAAVHFLLLISGPGPDWWIN